jgi:hypothetical protein
MKPNSGIRSGLLAIGRAAAKCLCQPAPRSRCAAGRGSCNCAACQPRAQVVPCAVDWGRPHAAGWQHSVWQQVRRRNLHADWRSVPAALSDSERTSLKAGQTTPAGRSRMHRIGELMALMPESPCRHLQVPAWSDRYELRRNRPWSLSANNLCSKNFENGRVVVLAARSTSYDIGSGWSMRPTRWYNEHRGKDGLTTRGRLQLQSLATYRDSGEPLSNW